MIRLHVSTMRVIVRHFSIITWKIITEYLCSLGIPVLQTVWVHKVVTIDIIIVPILLLWYFGKSSSCSVVLGLDRWYAHHRSKRTIQINRSTSFTPSIQCKYPTAANRKKSKTLVQQHILGYLLAAYRHGKPTSKYVWNFIQMQLHQQARRLLLHDPNAFNIYRTMKSAGVIQTSMCNKVKEPPQQQNN
jgi:hypothetical protein